MAEDPYATAQELGLMQGFPPPPDKRVNVSNALMTPPFNRWSYQNMRTVYPSAPLRAGETARRIDVETDRTIAGLTVPRPDGSPADFAAFLRETYTDALLVVTPDRLVYETYLNGMHAAQPHQMMSVTKSFAGLFALMAVDEGGLSEQTPVADVVPELSEASAFAGATFGQVLDMVNSMNFSEDYADPDSGIVRYGRALGWMPTPPDEPVPDNLYDFLVTLQMDPQRPHGEVFCYQTPKTDVVNWVTNRVTGRSFQDHMSERLWSKLGTDAEAYVLLDRNGTLVAGGGLNAAPHDLARFAMAMLNDGTVGDRQIIPVAVIDTIATGGDRAAFSRGPEAVAMMAGGDWSYRAQWWIRHTPGREAFSAIGVHGQWIYVDRRRGVAVVKQSSQPVSSDPDADQFVLNAIDAIVDHLGTAAPEAT
ncbi:MAG: serine hydrolase [Actinomycetota bacterium]|nr:serine hydrolase [Actinomycetota bacterium]